MRIGIDISVLQGASAQRGMGRYTLQQLAAVIDTANTDDLFFLFHQPFDPKPALPKSITQRENVQVISLNFPEAVSLRGGKFTSAGERAYTEAIQRFITPYRLDVFHLTCFDDNAYYYTPRAWAVSPLAMTLYDLIPLRMANVFLTNPEQSASYMAALDLMKQAAVLVAISEDARQNAIHALGISPERIWVAPPYASEDFHPISDTAPTPSIVQQIGEPYIYAISSFGDHKNLKRLMQGYAGLPDSLKSSVKLVVGAGTLRRDIPPDFAQLADSLGINERVVWLPRLSDDEVIALYQHAEVCSHVSLMEGFGLPILEAMQCGTPVLTSSRGAMKEVAGNAALCVDPEDISEITNGLSRLLTDSELCAELRSVGLEQAKSFNAERLTKNTRLAYHHITPRRLRVAMWSPLPPARSGISDYTAELVPYLAKYVDLVLYANASARRDLFIGHPVVVRSYDDYERYHSEPVDVHLYHMGNNLQFHEEIYFQLLSVPGVVILHDLSLFFFFKSLAEKYPDAHSLEGEVEYNEGLEARQKLAGLLLEWREIEKWDITKLPMVRRIAEASNKVIVHSQYAQKKLQSIYPYSGQFHYLPLATVVNPTSVLPSRDLQMPIIFGIFGGVNRVKRLHIILQSFVQVIREGNNARLLIVGRDDDSTYVDELATFIKRHHIEHLIEMHLDVALENFTQYIETTDVIINLRWPTSGEMSATLMRGLGAGKPIIASDIPQFRDFDPAFFWLVPVGKGEVETLKTYMLRMVKDRTALRENSKKALNFALNHASFEVVSSGYYHHLVTASIHVQERGPKLLPITGINIIGDLGSQTGLGEITRKMLHLLSEIQLPINYDELILDPMGRKPYHQTIETGRKHPINLVHLNPPFILYHMEQTLKERLSRRYNIGYWFHELPDLSTDWATASNFLDEIWVATEFVRKSIQKSTQIPVYVIPTPINVQKSSIDGRSRFALPQDRFVFLFSFSPESSAGRKNPFGLIKAYKKAFETWEQRPLLVLKTQFLDKFGTLADELRKQASLSGIHLIEENLSRDEVYSLIAACDCYISLHRSEGLGLGMAEAMALGKPVIATGWSGNIDFMDDENSYLVRYQLVSINQDHHAYQPEFLEVYPPGSSMWAEPDIDHAAELMRHVVENPADAAEKGRRAAQTIQEKYNPTVLGQHIKAHLATIDVSRGRYYNVQSEAVVHNLPQPLTPTHVPAQVTIPGVDMYHLQAAYNGWNRERLRTTIRGFGTVINRIPVIGFIFRTIVRIRNLGKVWGAESVLLEALVREAEIAQAQRSENARHITELYRRSDEIYAAVNVLQAQMGQLSSSVEPIEAAVEQIRDSIIRQAEERLRQMADSLRDLNTSTQHSLQQISGLSARHNDTVDQLNALQDTTNRQIRSLNVTIDGRFDQLMKELNAEIQRLSEGHVSLDDRTRLNTSQLRLLLLEMANALGKAFNPSPLEVVRWLEAVVPALAQSQRVDFTLQGVVDDGQMMALGHHWRGRLANIQPEVWYHFDRTDHWQGTALYDNARTKLAPSGLLVVVVSAAAVTWSQPDGFMSAGAHTFANNGSTVHIALYQKC